MPPRRSSSATLDPAASRPADPHSADHAGAGSSVAPFTLNLGDCLDPVTGLASLDDKSVDHVITDPPYDEHTHRCGQRGHTGYKEPESSRGATFNRSRVLGFDALKPEQMSELGIQFGRISRRWVLVFCSLEMISDWRRALEAGGLQYIRTAAWRKVGGAPQFTGDRPAVAIEAIVIAHPKGRKKWNGGGKHGFYEHPIVLNRGGVETRCHTTQKPLQLLAEIVGDFTDPGDLILDPFAGSGTTGIACRQLGRSFIGWELDSNYHEIASRRLNGERAVLNAAQSEMFGTKGPA